MKKLMLLVMCTGMLFGVMAPGYADYGRGDFGEWRGGIRSRIHEAEARIDRGVERGSLTRREADRLNMELNQILDKINRMREDGYLDHRERESINRDLDRLDRDITREKHDSDYRHRDDHERVYHYR